MLHTIGTDLEAFAVDKNGKHIALCGMIGGTKEQPLQIGSLPTGFMLQEDNVAVEFNIPPANSYGGFTKNVKTITNYVKKLLEFKNLTMSTVASATFDNDQLIHPNALVFGCEPDYNAWTVQENQKPVCDNPNLRTCGGHVHIGTQEDMLTVVHNMDLLLGVPSVILDTAEASIERRKLYGKAGAMRPKPYGLEYRTLSNFWMFNDNLTAWVGKQSVIACTGKQIVTKKDEKSVIECINTGNKEMALDLINKYGINVPEVL